MASPLLQILNNATPSYAIFRKKLDGGYYQVSSNKLYFTWMGEYNNGNLNYKLFNSAQSEITAGLGTLTRNYGDNRYMLDLSSSGLSAGQYYTIQVVDEKNETFLLKFKY